MFYKDQQARAELTKARKVVVQGLITDSQNKFLEFHHGNPNQKYIGVIEHTAGTQLFFTEDIQSNL